MSEALVVPIELITSSKPALSGRGLLASLALFLAVCALAASMSQQRKEHPLAERIRPPGWAVSLRPPRGFQRAVDAELSNPKVLQFLGSDSRRKTVVLVVRTLAAPPGMDPARLASRALAEDRQLQTTDTHLSTFEFSREPVGDLVGSQIFAREQATVARAAVAPSGDACVLMMFCLTPPLDAQMFRLFDLTCRSARFETN